MKKLLILSPALLVAGPVAAASKNPFSAEFYSLANTDFIVALGFIVFIGVLVYFGVPKMLTKMLDERADGIKADLEEARALREEAQALLASYERKQKDVQAQADEIVANAKASAEAAALQAKDDIAKSIERRLASAQDQIASAEASAIKDVRDQAISVAVSAAAELLSKDMSAENGDKLIDDAISQVQSKLH